MRLLTVFVLLAGMLALPAVAAVPGTVAVEGLLHGAGGGPVVDGNYDLTFALYAAETGGTALWSEPAKLAVKGGQFSHALGQQKPLSPTVLQAGLWLAGQVGSEPELARKPLHAVPFAVRAAVAEAIECSGCIAGSALKPGSLDGSALNFNYAGSDSKGGAATTAKLAQDLQCTGCVGVKEIAWDADVDLAGKGLKAGTVTAGEFVGSGAKLTGIVQPQGDCQVGQVVTGIGVDGKLKCGVVEAKLKPDGLAEVSNGALTNVFQASFPGLKAGPLGIKDYYPKGVTDEVTVPDLGVAQSVSVSLELKNSDMATVQVSLFAPDNTEYVLYDKGSKGTALKTTFPKPTALAKGDLATWVGKNPMGTWTLRVVDSGFSDVPTDGEVSKWALEVKVLSGKKVEVKGDLVVGGKILAGDGSAPGFVPKGAVMAFALQKCPEGWVAADGQNGTPDLRGRFPIGAGPLPQGSGTVSLGAGGGSNKYRVSAWGCSFGTGGAASAGNDQRGLEWLGESESVVAPPPAPGSGCKSDTGPWADHLPPYRAVLYCTKS